MEGLFLALGIVALVWLGAIVALVAIGRRAAARELAVFVPNAIWLFKGLLGDPRVPWPAKLLLGVAMLWLISPIDLIPEFVPIAGPLDDAIVVAIVLRAIVGVADRDVLATHWRGAPETLDLVLRLARVAHRTSATET